jgi:hypothetical protein
MTLVLLRFIWENRKNEKRGSVQVRDAMNRRFYKRLIIVETAIYRVFVIYNFHQKTLTERY